MDKKVTLQARTQAGTCGVDDQVIIYNFAASDAPADPDILKRMLPDASDDRIAAMLSTIREIRQFRETRAQKPVVEKKPRAPKTRACPDGLAWFNKTQKIGACAADCAPLQEPFWSEKDGSWARDCKDPCAPGTIRKGADCVPVVEKKRRTKKQPVCPEGQTWLKKTSKIGACAAACSPPQEPLWTAEDGKWKVACAAPCDPGQTRVGAVCKATRKSCAAVDLVYSAKTGQCAEKKGQKENRKTCEARGKTWLEKNKREGACDVPDCPETQKRVWDKSTPGCARITTKLDQYLESQKKYITHQTTRIHDTATGRESGAFSTGDDIMVRQENKGDAEYEFTVMYGKIVGFKIKDDSYWALIDAVTEDDPPKRVVKWVEEYLLENPNDEADKIEIGQRVAWKEHDSGVGIVVKVLGDKADVQFMSGRTVLPMAELQIDYAYQDKLIIYNKYHDDVQSDTAERLMAAEKAAPLPEAITEAEQATRDNVVQKIKLSKEEQAIYRRFEQKELRFKIKDDAERSIKKSGKKLRDFLKEFGKPYESEWSYAELRKHALAADAELKSYLDENETLMTTQCAQKVIQILNSIPPNQVKIEYNKENAVDVLFRELNKLKTEAAAPKHVAVPQAAVPQAAAPLMMVKSKLNKDKVFQTSTGLSASAPFL